MHKVSRQKIAQSLLYTNARPLLSANLKNRKDPKEVLALAEIWNKRYQAAYLSLKAKGLDVRSESDIEKIEEELGSLLSPIEWAKEKTIELIVEQYLQKLGTIMKFLGSAPVQALKVFRGRATPRAISMNLLLQIRGCPDSNRAKTLWTTKTRLDENIFRSSEKSQTWQPSIGPKP